MAVVSKQLSEAINEFLKQDSIVGLSLQQGKTQINNRLPLSDSRNEQLTDTVHQLCHGFDAVGRHAKHYIYDYNSGSLVIVCLGEVRLVLLLQKGANIDLLAEHGRTFLENHTRDFLQPREELLPEMQQPAQGRPTPDSSRVSLDLTRPITIPTTRTNPPSQEVSQVAEAPQQDEELWATYRDALSNIFSKVHGGAQVKRLIEREVVALGGNSKDGIPFSKFQTLGDKLIEKVANKSRRRTLLFDLNELYTEMGISVN